MITIHRISAREILDSRGRPTLLATCNVQVGDVRATASASVPSGASTGSAEALELRDGDPTRYGGRGCRLAVGHVNGEISDAVRGREFANQSQVDRLLIELDGTPNKARLGANAILAVSLAFARATSSAKRIPLYQHFANLCGLRLETLPRLTINLFSGGKHAGGQVPIQDVLIVPASATSIDAGLAMAFAVYQAAARLTARKYNARALRADEGGLAPPFPDAEAMLSDAVESISKAGLEPGRDVMLAVDVASSHFFKDGRYAIDGKSLDSAAMIERLAGWVARFPIVSLEDGLAEGDWEHWPTLRAALAGKALVVGDDLLCTKVSRIQRAVDAGAADTLLLKVNQVGTLTEAADALRLAQINVGRDSQRAKRRDGGRLAR